MIKRTFKLNTWIQQIFLAGVLCLVLTNTVSAKTNVDDELWEKDLMDIKPLGKADIRTDLTQSSEKPIIIDVLDLKKMDILDVLKLISQKSGLNIVAGSDVKGKVTVFLRNVEVHDVLRIIVEAYGWAYVQDGSVMKVMTEREFTEKFGHRFGQETETRIKQLSYANAPDIVPVLKQMKSTAGKVIMEQNSRVLILTDEPKILDKMDAVIAKMDVLRETKVFNLSYARADDLSGKISEMLTPSLGAMKFDGRSNSIMVSDTASVIKEVSDLVEAFDRKEREVLIEAKIMQVTLTDEYQLGVDWEAIVQDYHNLQLTNNFDVLGDLDKRGKLGIGTIDSDNYTVFVEALKTVGNTEILSSPRVTVVNNKEAKILVGSTEPYVTTTTTTPSSGPTTTAESVSFIEVGVKLYVTPTIHEDDFITMKIKPEVSSVVRNVTTSNNNTIPVVETSEAETTVMVKDDVTIVIGGLIKEEKIKTTKKVPLLGSIPILGFAFRSRDDLVRKTEIVLFLTPKIISGDVNDVEKLAKRGQASLGGQGK